MTHSSRLVLILIGALLVLGAWFALVQIQAQRQRARGHALFDGAIDLRGRLAGHDLRLPVMATRCVNCHEAPAAAVTPGVATAGGAGASGDGLGLALNRARLSTMISRRGGPATVFTVTAFCTALRTGIDPANVILPTVMPRYDLSDPQCADLWAYLQSR